MNHIVLSSTMTKTLTTTKHFHHKSSQVCALGNSKMLLLLSTVLAGLLVQPTWSFQVQSFPSSTTTMITKPTRLGNPIHSLMLTTSSRSTTTTTKSTYICLAAAAEAAATDSSSSDEKKRTLIIWDCDGVLVDSEALLKQGEVEALAQDYGITVTVEDCVRMFSGVSPDQAIRNFKEATGQDMPDDFFPKQIAGSMDLFRQRLQPLMLETIQKLHDDLNAIQCIASGSPKDRVELCVDVAGMRPYFPSSVVYTRELVKRGKPAPDLFLHAAKEMGFDDPTDCIVVEDSTSGIIAAQAAGMEVLGFLGGGHATADWYQKAIYDLNIPVVKTQQEVYDYLASRTVYLEQQQEKQTQEQN